MPKERRAGRRDFLDVALVGAATAAHDVQLRQHMPLELRVPGALYELLRTELQ
jgi:hypothetical protein